MQSRSVTNCIVFTSCGEFDVAAVDKIYVSLNNMRQWILFLGSDVYIDKVDIAVPTTYTIV